MTDENQNAGQWPVDPTRLSGASPFRFACHSGLACWGTCCRHMDIILSPYDILRLKKRLGLSSPEFIQSYTVPSVHQESALPLVLLKMGDDKERVCPFLSDEGCTAYADRPAICRYYPIGLASLMARKEGADRAAEERFYFRIREGYCLGNGEKREWTVDQWREDQGVIRSDEANRDWQAAFLSRSLPGEAKLDPQRMAHFHLACYDLDTFRRFILKSSFLDRFEVDPGTVKAVTEDDEELLRFALRYMKHFMMMEQTMTPKKGAVEDWRKKQEED